MSNCSPRREERHRQIKRHLATGSLAAAPISRASLGIAQHHLGPASRHVLIVPTQRSHQYLPSELHPTPRSSVADALALSSSGLELLLLAHTIAVQSR